MSGDAAVFVAVRESGIGPSQHLALPQNSVSLPGYGGSWRTATI
jgi:hypothetical protein